VLVISPTYDNAQYEHEIVQANLVYAVDVVQINRVVYRDCIESI
jgi:hypothetical protein